LCGGKSSTRLRGEDTVRRRRADTNSEASIFGPTVGGHAADATPAPELPDFVINMTDRPACLVEAPPHFRSADQPPFCFADKEPPDTRAAPQKKNGDPIWIAVVRAFLRQPIVGRPFPSIDQSPRSSGQLCR
jgi:hypothetical protein